MQDKFKKVYELLDQVDGDIISEAIELIEMIELDVEELKDYCDTLECVIEEQRDALRYPDIFVR